MLLSIQVIDLTAVNPIILDNTQHLCSMSNEIPILIDITLIYTDVKFQSVVTR